MPGVQACSTCAHLSTHKGITANFDVYGTICNLYLCEHHAIITTQWSLKVMSHDYNNYNNNYYIHIMYIILWICLKLIYRKQKGKLHHRKTTNSPSNRSEKVNVNATPMRAGFVHNEVESCPSKDVLSHSHSAG